MKALIVYAHPDANSLTAALKDLAVSTLRTEGHDVVVSDLYAMKWQSAADFTDFDGITGPDFMHASGTAFETGRLSPDIRAEQQKLLDADLVLLLFPLWWFTVPAILKGWIDRVFTYNFAYGAALPRYGDGPLAGKRAMLATLTGGRAGHYTPRGVNGPIEDLLFPLNHGLLHFTGFDVLPPFVEHSAVHLSDDHYGQITDRFRMRLTTAFTTDPIPYRSETGGDYTALTHPDGSELRPDRETPGTTGFNLHLAH
ncbi:NAD(P)H-dependent oxidoreductase [Glycomyces luteolus]|uniref:NAD(P)H-dependent oxidoreductase n=1 Tax=Glycomyces luteolus TaxID=2670330 RepID=A0A9X3P7Z8_9ACTN|nr:NAD(P)H-dependent oxidoreductase [Glycomyces luteolus]MDA1358613.1 NAD(P)H-dependent oxidoreductase [Glycomyces luteolus]